MPLYSQSLEIDGEGTTPVLQTDTTSDISEDAMQTGALQLSSTDLLNPASRLSVLSEFDGYEDDSNLVWNDERTKEEDLRGIRVWPI